MVERNLRRAPMAALSGAGAATGRAPHVRVLRAATGSSRSGCRGRPPPTSTRGIVVDGFEHVSDGLAAGNGRDPRPAAPRWLGVGGVLAHRVKRVPVSAVVEAIEPPELFEWFVDLRRAFGLEIIPLGPTAGADVHRGRCKANRIVCLLCDRDIGGGGIEVEFFGERTTLPGRPGDHSPCAPARRCCPCAVYFRRATAITA